MTDLIKNLMDKANLDETVAKKVVDVVADFVEDKVPAPAGDMAAKAIRGLDVEDVAEDVMDKVGDLF